MKITYSHKYDDNFTLKEICQSRKFKDKCKDGLHKSYQKEKVKGTLSLMCPWCYEVYDVNVDIDIKASMETSDRFDIESFVKTLYHTDKCINCNHARELITLDPNLADIISILNKKGFYTKFCCEDHKDNNGILGYIYFQDMKILDYEHLLPDSVYVDLNDLRDHLAIIRWEYCNKTEALIGLLQFVEQLPNLSDDFGNLMRKAIISAGGFVGR